MTNCENTRDSIGRWLDGELSPGESATVSSHVANCAECGEARRQLESLQRALTGVLLTEAAPIEFMPFWREVQRRINRPRAWYEDSFEWARGFFTAPRIAWGVPAVIALLLAAFSLDSYFPGSRFDGGRNGFASVESIDAHGRNVALLREDESKTTVIWLYQNEEGENEVGEDSSKSGPTF
jgi:anti-sigma factor RsiW